MADFESGSRPVTGVLFAGTGGTGDAPADLIPRLPSEKSHYHHTGEKAGACLTDIMEFDDW